MIERPADWTASDALWTECSGVIQQLLPLNHTDPLLARYENALDHMTRVSTGSTGAANPTTTSATPLTPEQWIDPHTLPMLAAHIDALLNSTQPPSLWQRLTGQQAANSDTPPDPQALRQLFAKVYQARERAQHVSHQLTQLAQQQHSTLADLDQHIARIDALLQVFALAQQQQAFVDPQTANRLNSWMTRLAQRHHTAYSGQLHTTQQQHALALIEQQQRDLLDALEQAYQQLLWINQSQQLNQQHAWRQRLMQSRQHLTPMV